jgi:hypothetical protein
MFLGLPLINSTVLHISCSNSTESSFESEAFVSSPERHRSYSSVPDPQRGRE